MEIELGLFTGFEDMTALEDKKSLTVFSAIAVVCCTLLALETPSNKNEVCRMR